MVFLLLLSPSVYSLFSFPFYFLLPPSFLQPSSFRYIVQTANGEYSTTVGSAGRVAVKGGGGPVRVERASGGGSEGSESRNESRNPRAAGSGLTGSVTGLDGTSPEEQERLDQQRVTWGLPRHLDYIYSGSMQV